MDPGVANADDSRMPSDLAHSQVAILSGVWNDWSEPNDSRKVGSDEGHQGPAPRLLPRRLLRRRPSDGVPLYELWVRKDSGRCRS